MEIQKENNEKDDKRSDAKNARMSAEEVALLLSQTVRDMAEKKTTMRYAVAMSRLAVALAKVIETVDLQERVELLERVLEKRKTK